MTNTDKQVLDAILERKDKIIAELEECGPEQNQGVTDVLVGGKKYGVHFADMRGGGRLLDGLNRTVGRITLLPVSNIKDPSIHYFVFYDAENPGYLSFALGDTIRTERAEELRTASDTTMLECTFWTIRYEDINPKWRN